MFHVSCLSLNHREEKQPISCQRAVIAYDQKTPRFCLKQKLSWEMFTSFSIILWSKNLSFAGQNKSISIIISAQKNKAKHKEEPNPCAPWALTLKCLAGFYLFITVFFPYICLCAASDIWKCLPITKSISHKLINTSIISFGLIQFSHVHISVLIHFERCNMRISN